MEKKPITNIIAGFILFLVMVVYTLIINIGKLQDNMMLGWFSYFIIIAGIAIFVVKYGKDMNGNITFGNLFAFGFKTTAVVAIFFIAFMVLFYLVFPEYKEQMLELGRQKALVNAKGTNPEDIEKGMEIFKRFFWVGLIAGIMLSYAILGAIGSLIGAAITKKDPRPVEDVNQIGQ
ncbi:MAG TPA: DUF4199 domain-containing protein [Chitinophagaceae bacterium]